MKQKINDIVNSAPIALLDVPAHLQHILMHKTCLREFKAKMQRYL